MSQLESLFSSSLVQVAREITLANPPSTLTEGELHILQELFVHPTIKKYFNTLLWNAIRDLASIPVTEIANEDYRNRHAYTKGCIGILTTLLSIQDEQPKVKG